ncbi:hypothetical protein H072_2310 [Dactylellina haptotyla CBS 200.50]|uniref:Uncharacterized protein n=1 Tax=Dactylellina haptotyla (strain CBS 200.50) TaxID=1284197 RepID=S8C7J1_DACHA|nr:hypothetical protein H072_2310 [Dactylellina haptotyla CBS 200.50]
MAPLGIITAVVSAIRVGGPRWLRAIIGRARESKGEAELELMSSTSADVCELWNGETIVRTLGSPYVTEVLWLEKTDSVQAIGPSTNSDGSDEDTLLDTQNEESRRAFLAPFAGVFSLTDALTAKLVRSSRNTDVVEVNYTPSQLFDNNVFELEADPVLVSVPAPESRRRRRRQKHTENIVVCPPNLSLNVTGDATSRTELAIVALFASLFQFGVIAFQLVITYLHPFNENFTKNDRRAPPYACPLTVAGTLFVILGMFACSMVVQKRSKEEDWYLERKNIPEGYRLRIAWLQRHQRVTDQNFGGFCLYAPTNRRRIMSSRFNNTKESPNVATVLGSAISIVGFVVQFTGLRGMHYSATLAQLAATLFASLLRIMVRRQLGNRPILDTVPDGQELDWMARKTTNCSKWTVKPLNTSDPPEEGDLGTFAARSRLREICPLALRGSFNNIACDIIGKGNGRSD